MKASMNAINRLSSITDEIDALAEGLDIKVSSINLDLTVDGQMFKVRHDGAAWTVEHIEKPKRTRRPAITTKVLTTDEAIEASAPKVRKARKPMSEATKKAAAAKRAATLAAKKAGN